MENKDIDQHIDKTLKSCFDAQKHTAPKAIWDKIADGLDSESLLDTKLKEAGEETLHKAPIGLWKAIASDLDGAIAIDDAIDQKIKESITTEPVQEVPSVAWAGIEKQLNLDQTWNNIADALPKEGTPVVSSSKRWRKSINRIAAVAMLLLLLRTCVGDIGIKQWSNPILVHQESTNETTFSNREEGEKNGINSTANTSLFDKDQEESNLDRKTENRVKETVSSNSIPKGSIIAEIGAEIEAPKERINSSSSKSNSLLFQTEMKEPKKNQEKNQPLPTIAKTNTSLGQENVNELGKEKNNRVARNSGVEGLESLFSKNILLGNKVNPLQYELLSNEVEISSEEFTLLDNVLEVEPSPLEGKLSVGIFTVFNSTTLLNEETREGFSGSGRVQNAPRFAANYGVWIGYQFLPKSSLIVEFSINADNRQAYRIVEDQISYTKEWVMKYNRISLGYQHDLMQTEGKVSSRIVAQGGIYLGLLRQAKLFYDGELFFDAVADHHQFDFGFKIALGQELTFGKFALGYGIRSDLGATNIFKGNNFFPAQENKTNLLQLGGYITLGYKF